MKLVSIIVMAAMAMSMLGCRSRTGYVFVDKRAARISGIEIESFRDNPIFTEIMYDYSGIDDFDESRIMVALNFMPEIYTNYAVDYDEVDEGGGQFIPLGEEDRFDFPDQPMGYHWKQRGVTIVDRKPGYIKIFSLDDIGMYSVTYK